MILEILQSKSALPTWALLLEIFIVGIVAFLFGRYIFPKQTHEMGD